MKDIFPFVFHMYINMDGSDGHAKLSGQKAHETSTLVKELKTTVEVGNRRGWIPQEEPANWLSNTK